MNTRTRHHDDDNDRERDRRDRRGLLRDGERMRVPTFLMDGVQHAIADAFGDSSDEALSRPGPRFAPGLTRDSNTPDRDEVREFADAERAAEYRGGLKVGDRVDLGGKSFTVERRDADGRTKLAIDRRSGEALKEAAYEAYDAEQSAAWAGASDGENSVRQEGESCTTKEGKKGRVVRRNMALVCEPISDSTDALPDLIQQHDAIVGDAYAEYSQEITNAWRSK